MAARWQSIPSGDLRALLSPPMPFLKELWLTKGLPWTINSNIVPSIVLVAALLGASSQDVPWGTARSRKHPGVVPQARPHGLLWGSRSLGLRRTNRPQGPGDSGVFKFGCLGFAYFDPYPTHRPPRLSVCCGNAQPFGLADLRVFLLADWHKISPRTDWPGWSLLAKVAERLW